MAFIHSPKIITEGLRFYLDVGNNKSYPGSGTLWRDISGNNNSGSLVNGPTFNASNGGSLAFDGTNDYVALPNNSINSNSDLTLVFWSKVNSFTVASCLLGTYAGIGHLQVRYDAAGRIDVVKSYIAQIGPFTAYTATVNTINNIVITKSSSTYRLYIDGIYRDQVTSAQTFNTGTPALGTNYNTAGASLVELLNGNLYAFMLYNRALSDLEVLQNFNALRSRFGI